MKIQTSIRWHVLALSVLALALGMLPTPARAEENACQGGDRVAPVTAFGHPRTTFSKESAETLEDLQRLFAEHENDLREVFELANWDGDPELVFAAVRAGEAVERAVPQGSVFDWMAFRKRGKPACVRNILWKGAEPFPAWTVEVESNGYRHTVVIPKACLNISVERGTKRMVPPPSCDLSARFDPQSDRIEIRGATDGAEIAITGVRGPDGAGDLASLEKVGSGVWHYAPPADGRYSFEANSRHASGSQNSDCAAVVDVVRRKPEFACTTTVDPESGVVSIDTSASVGTASLTGVTLPDGGSGDSSSLSGGTFDSSESLPKQPGEYTYTFSGVAQLNGFEDSGSCSATVKRLSRRELAAAARSAGTCGKGLADGAWIFRGFGAGADTSGATIMNGPVRLEPGPLAPFVTTKRTIGDGSGFGLGLERLMGKCFGLELGALFLDLDGNRIVDRGDDWTMTSPGVGFDAISLGLNYHLTPNRAVDVYVGPFVSNVSFSDNGFNDGEPSFGSEIGVGAKIGADWYFGRQSPWALSTALHYLPITAGDDGNEFDIDPLVAAIGLGYRF